MDNVNLIIFTGTYIVGFLLTLVVLNLYGKSKLGFDYYQPKTYVDCDDWGNNNIAFVVFSLTWPVFWLMELIKFIFKCLLYFSSFLSKNLNKDEE